MKLDQTKTAVITAFGVAALNVVYLWDIIIGTYVGGMIYIGMSNWVGIVIANLAIIACLVKLASKK